MPLLCGQISSLSLLIIHSATQLAPLSALEPEHEPNQPLVVRGGCCYQLIKACLFMKKSCNMNFMGTFCFLFFPQILLQPVDNITEVSPCLQNFLKRYNDEFSGEGLDLSISSHVMFHVVRLHRILSYKNR